MSGPIRAGSLALDRWGTLPFRARMRDPGAIAAGLIGAFDGDAGFVQPQRHGTAPPGIDAVDDRHHRSAPEAGGHLADDRIDSAAFDREGRSAGNDRDPAAAR